MKRSLLSVIAIAALAPQAANAVPYLQLFVEAGTPGSDNYTVWDGHDAEDPETWAAIGSDPFRIWTIAKLEDTTSSSSTNVATAYDKVSGKIVSKTITTTNTVTQNSYQWDDIRFVASFDHGLTPALDWTGVNGTTVAGYTLTTPTLVNDNPFRVGGALTPDPIDVDPWDGYIAKNWPHHDMFGDDRDWAEWQLGPIYKANTAIGDFQPDSLTAPFFGGDSNYPDPTNSRGQIRAYDLLPSGLLPGDQVHFDLWGTYDSVSMVCSTATVQKYSYTTSSVQTGTDKNGKPKYSWVTTEHDEGLTTVDYGCKITNTLDHKFAPWSHDARWEQAENFDVPAPGAAALLSLGLFGFVGFRRKYVAKASSARA